MDWVSLFIERKGNMNIDFFYSECKRIEEIAEKYHDVHTEYYNKIKRNVVRIEYGIGGEVLHRGYYCPSIVQDIIIGNVKRGKSVKKKPIKTPERIYGFDSNNQLITSERTFEKEFIIRNGQKELGIMASGFGDLSSISECVYDENEKIMLYSFFSYDPFKRRVTEVHQEVYEYKENQLIFDWYRFSSGVHFNNIPLFGHDRYTFSIENTYLTTYTSEYYNVDGSKKPSVWDGHVFKVDLKRKI